MSQSQIAQQKWAKNDFDWLTASQLGAIGALRGGQESLSEQQGMEPFQVVADADQVPFALCLEQTTQGELSETYYFFDDADDRFNGTFAQTINGLADGGL